MRELTWLWTLPSGDAVKATLDRHRDMESVWLGPRLASRSRIGQRPEGHLIGLARGRAGPYRSGAVIGAAHDLQVIFDRQDDPLAPPTCALWLGSVPIAPRPASRAGARIAIGAVLVGALLAAMGWAL